MAGLVAAKAKITREKAYASVMSSVTSEVTAPMSSTPPLPAANVAVVASTPSARPSADGAPTAAPRKTPAIRPVAPHLRAPAPVETADPRADATPHVDLLDAMQAAVARHSAPPGAVKVDCPPAPEGSSGLRLHVLEQRPEHRLSILDPAERAARAPAHSRASGRGIIGDFAPRRALAASDRTSPIRAGRGTDSTRAESSSHQAGGVVTWYSRQVSGRSA